MILQPPAGELVVTVMIGAYVLVYGTALIALWTRLRQWNVVGGERNTLRPTRS